MPHSQPSFSVMFPLPSYLLKNDCIGIQHHKHGNKGSILGKSTAPLLLRAGSTFLQVAVGLELGLVTLHTPLSSLQVGEQESDCTAHPHLPCIVSTVLSCLPCFLYVIIKTDTNLCLLFGGGSIFCWCLVAVKMGGCAFMPRVCYSSFGALVVLG